MKTTPAFLAAAMIAVVEAIGSAGGRAGCGGTANTKLS